jgi:hypothetical protein
MRPFYNGRQNRPNKFLTNPQFIEHAPKKNQNEYYSNFEGEPISFVITSLGE